MEKGFDRLAAVYDLGVRFFFGNTLLKAQSHFFPELKKGERALIVGGGTGAFLPALLKENPTTKYDYVELSVKMLQRAEKRVSTDQVQFFHRKIPEQQYDLIITPFVLDCYEDEELFQWMQQLSNHLKPKAQWLFTDFHASKGRQKTFIQLLYFFFRIVGGLKAKRLPHFSTHFEKLGWKKEREKFFRNGLVQTVLYQKT